MTALLPLAPARALAPRRRWHRPRWLGALARQAASATDPAAHTAKLTRARHGRPGGAPISAECEAFIRQHERAILNYLWRMTGDEQAAYDLTQEVFVRAWQRFDAVRAYEQPRGWLFRVATNLALTHLRRHGAPAAGPVALDAAPDPAASDPARRVVERDQVRRVLLQLAPQRRAALVLREVYGLSCAEVAQTLALPAASVRMALHRAREQFRALYLREEGGNG
jgi:RNA polymerase sigma-70 factor (ECF subfamily)